MSDLEARRTAERSKYLQLQEIRPEYGASFHGRPYVSRIVDLEPRCVLDFGCGRNNFIDSLRGHGIFGAGIDFAYPEADFQCPMHETTLEDGVADVITAFDSLEHLLPDEVDQVLGEMKRVATPSFSFFFTVCPSPSRITVDGENLHPTVRPLHWWEQRIREVFGTSDTRTEGHLIWGTVRSTETE